MLQQHFIQAADLLHRTVIEPHELLNAGIVRGAKTEFGGDIFLVVEQQPVLSPAGNNVERVAHTPEEIVSLVETVVLGLGQEIVFDQVPEPLRVKMSFRDPADHLDVAQTAGAFLHIGLQVVLAVVELMVARRLFFPFGCKEFPGRPYLFRSRHFDHGFIQGCIADYQPGFHEVRGYRYIRLCFLDTVLDCSDAMPYIQTHVPEKGQKGLDAGFQGFFSARLDEQHQVHVGCRQ